MLVRYNVVPPVDSVQLVYNSNFTRTYGRYIYSIHGILNQLITRGHHLVAINQQWFDAFYQLRAAPAASPGPPT